MTRVFVDTGGFFALLAPEDAHHSRAEELFKQAQTEHRALVTTNAVIYEAHGLILNRAREGRRPAMRFLELVAEGLCRVQRVAPRDEARALEILRTYADKDFSLCDALSFAVMTRLRITRAISFDRHFREYGKFTIL